MSKFDACGSDAFVFAREQGNSSTGRLRGVVGRAAGANKERSAYGSNLWHNPVAFVSPGYYAAASRAVKKIADAQRDFLTDVARKEEQHVHGRVGAGSRSPGAEGEAGGGAGGAPAAGGGRSASSSSTSTGVGGRGGNSSDENREKKPTARKQHLERSDHFDAVSREHEKSNRAGYRPMRPRSVPHLGACAMKEDHLTWHEHTRSASAVPPQTAFLEDDDPNRIYPADSNPHGRARPNFNGKMREIRTELAEEESRRQHERDLLANTRTSLLYSNSPTDTMLQYGQYIVGGRASSQPSRATYIGAVDESALMRRTVIEQDECGTGGGHHGHGISDRLRDLAEPRGGRQPKPMPRPRNWVPPGNRISMFAKCLRKMEQGEAQDQENPPTTSRRAAAAKHASPTSTNLLGPPSATMTPTYFSATSSPGSCLTTLSKLSPASTVRRPHVLSPRMASPRTLSSNGGTNKKKNIYSTTTHSPLRAQLNLAPQYSPRYFSYGMKRAAAGAAPSPSRSPGPSSERRPSSSSCNGGDALVDAPPTLRHSSNSKDGTQLEEVPQRVSTAALWSARSTTQEVLVGSEQADGLFSAHQLQNYADLPTSSPTSIIPSRPPSVASVVGDGGEQPMRMATIVEDSENKSSATSPSVVERNSARESTSAAPAGPRPGGAATAASKSNPTPTSSSTRTTLRQSRISESLAELRASKRQASASTTSTSSALHLRNPSDTRFVPPRSPSRATTVVTPTSPIPVPRNSLVPPPPGVGRASSPRTVPSSRPSARGFGSGGRARSSLLVDVAAGAVPTLSSLPKNGPEAANNDAAEMLRTSTSASPDANTTSRAGVRTPPTNAMLSNLWRCPSVKGRPSPRTQPNSAKTSPLEMQPGSGAHGRARAAAAGVLTAKQQGKGANRLLPPNARGPNEHSTDAPGAGAKKGTTTTTRLQKTPPSRGRGALAF